MFDLNAKRMFTVVAVILTFITTNIAQQSQEPPSPPPTPTPSCKGVGCSGVSRAELFIQGFATAGNSKGVRTSDLAMEEKVRLAFYGIDATRVEVEKGRLTQAEGDFIIDGHRRVIADYVHDNSNDALITASSGQVSDIPALRKSMGALLSVARQDALFGREDLAMEAQAKMVRVLTTFSQRFAETCEQQQFPAEIAVGIERQNELFGTDISLEHCMKRKASVEINSQGVKYYFETCWGLDDPWLQNRKWKLKISGRVNGEGWAEESMWEAKTNFLGFKDEPSGEMNLDIKVIEVKEDTVKVPNDAGPNAKPNGRVSAPIPRKQNERKLENVLKMKIKTILLTGSRGFEGSGMGPWAESEVKMEEKPCKN